MQRPQSSGAIGFAQALPHGVEAVRGGAKAWRRWIVWGWRAFPIHVGKIGPVLLFYKKTVLGQQAHDARDDFGK
jgi:hypothetical protein